VSLKSAGEQRKAENELFRQTVADQRATINILSKALERLKTFYMTKKAFMQTQRVTTSRTAQPAPAKEYEKSAGAGGVMQMMDKIITDASSAEAAMVKDEQHAEKAYASIVNDAAASIEANNAAIIEKTKFAEDTNGDMSSTKAALLENGDEASHLRDMLKGMHLDCDFLLQYYDVRQKSRAEELDAIADAKAILSGANEASTDEE